MISGIVLAAGVSSRLGRPKQLLDLEGRPVLQHVIDAADAAGVDEVLVVLGHEAERIAAAVRLPPRARVVVNPEYAKGQSASLRAGLRAADTRSRAAVVLLGDAPDVRPDAIRLVVEAYRDAGGQAVQASYGGTRGHPVVLDRSLWPRVEEIEGDVGARGLLADATVVEAGGAPPLDIDTPEDYARVARSRARTRWIVTWTMLGVIVVWGSAFSGIKLLLRELGPAGLTFGRLAIAAGGYVALLPLGRGGPVRREPGDLPRLVVLGLSGMVGYHLALNWGSQFVSAGVASLIVASMPAMVAVAAAVVLREVLGPRRGIGVVAAFVGVGLLLAFSGQRFEVRNTVGVLAVLAAPVSWTVYTIVSKPLAARYDGVRLNMLGAWLAVALVLPIAVGDLGGFARLSASGWAWLVFLGAVPSAVAYVAYIWALRVRPASAVASFVNLVPLSSLLWAWALLGEVPTLSSLGGGALIIGGVALVQSAGSR